MSWLLTLLLWAACQDATGETPMADDGDGPEARAGRATHASPHPPKDCDGQAEARTWFLDRDGDGWGDGSRVMVACMAPAGFVENGQDQDDQDPAAR